MQVEASTQLGRGLWLENSYVIQCSDYGSLGGNTINPPVSASPIAMLVCVNLRRLGLVLKRKRVEAVIGVNTQPKSRYSVSVNQTGMEERDFPE